MLDFKCQHCGECCRRYYIISLPREIEGQAKFLGMEKSEFLEKKAQLFLRIFPSGHTTEKSVVSSALIPKKFSEIIEGHLGYAPEFFIVIPMVAFLRKENGECQFYEKEKGCTIYPARPLECRLFPFIPDRKVTDYSKAYPFCHGLHFTQIADYCALVKEKGFSKVWGTWPKKGILLLEDKLVGKSLTDKEFFDCIAPFA